MNCKSILIRCVITFREGLAHHLLWEGLVLLGRAHLFPCLVVLSFREVVLCNLDDLVAVLYFAMEGLLVRVHLFPCLVVHPYLLYSEGRPFRLSEIPAPYSWSSLPAYPVSVQPQAPRLRPCLPRYLDHAEALSGSS